MTVRKKREKERDWEVKLKEVIEEMGDAPLSSRSAEIRTKDSHNDEKEREKESKAQVAMDQYDVIPHIATPRFASYTLYTLTLTYCLPPSLSLSLSLSLFL